MPLLTFSGNRDELSANGAVKASNGIVPLGGHMELTATEQAAAETDGMEFISGPSVSPGAPAVGTFAAAEGGAGALSAGAYKWVVTFVTAKGETLASAEIGATLAAAKQANLTNVPLGPAGAGVTERKIYRTKAAGATGTEKLVGSIANNTTTTFTDNIADGSLGASIPAADTSSNIAQAETAKRKFRWHLGE